MLNLIMSHKYYKKVVLVILDGFGIAPDVRGNAISRAYTPTLNYIVANFPALPLQASGPLVGAAWTRAERGAGRAAGGAACLAGAWAGSTAAKAKRSEANG